MEINNFKQSVSEVEHKMGILDNVVKRVNTTMHNYNESIQS